MDKIKGPDKTDDATQEQDDVSKTLSTEQPVQYRQNNNISNNGHYKSKDKQEKRPTLMDNIPQWIMAIFTILIAIITFFYMLSAREQVIQMRKAVNIASDTAIRQLRAYIFLNGISIKNITENQKPIIIVDFKNTGQTPAYEVSILVGNQFREYPLASMFDLHSINEHNSGAKSPVPSGGKFISNNIMAESLTSKDIDNLKAGTHAIYVTGEINYKDGFGNERFTKFLAFYNKSVGIGSTSVNAYSEGNEAN
jgi:hypothetical protein